MFAPAKINLYLHVLGRVTNGYHALDSLITFFDIGDTITIKQNTPYGFTISGDFATSFPAPDLDHSPNSSNLIIKAAWKMAEIAQQKIDFSIHLQKDLPLGAGIGGGSSDAAAIIHILCKHWDVPTNHPTIKELLKSLGDDVPVCFAKHTARLTGLGVDFKPAPTIPKMPVALVHPGIACLTGHIFQTLNLQPGDHLTDPIPIPTSFPTQDALLTFLNTTDNTLYPAARKLVPAIENVILSLNAQTGCQLARMSGSGSCCFGIFKTAKDAHNAAVTLRKQNPDWWVRDGFLG